MFVNKKKAMHNSLQSQQLEPLPPHCSDSCQCTGKQLKQVWILHIPGANVKSTAKGATPVEARDISPASTGSHPGIAEMTTTDKITEVPRRTASNPEALPADITNPSPTTEAGKTYSSENRRNNN